MMGKNIHRTGWSWESWEGRLRTGGQGVPGENGNRRYRRY